MTERGEDVDLDLATSTLCRALLRRIGADHGTVRVRIEAVAGVPRRLLREFVTPGSALDEEFPIPPESPGR